MKRAILLVFVAATCSGCANKATVAYIESRYGPVDQDGKIYQHFEGCVKRFIETHAKHTWAHNNAMVEGSREQKAVDACMEGLGYKITEQRHSRGSGGREVKIIAAGACAPLHPSRIPCLGRDFHRRGSGLRPSRLSQRLLVSRVRFSCFRSTSSGTLQYQRSASERRVR
jgi:hypothetical protein